MDGPDALVDRRVVEVGQRRVRAHAAGVRAAVAVAQPLVVAGRGQGDRAGPVAHGDDARLAALEPRLDDEGRDARRPPGEEGRGQLEGLLRRARHDHALAGGEPVGLEDGPVARVAPARG